MIFSFCEKLTKKSVSEGRFMLRVSKKVRRRILFFCVLALCFHHTINAQSGRRSGKTKVSAEQTTPVKPQSAETKSETPEAKPPVKISSLVVFGEVQYKALFYKSNDLENSLKEFISFTKLVSKNVPAMTRVDKKMNYSEAKEQAKKETDAFTLWIGFAAKDDAYGNMYIDLLQYAILKPQTGEILTRGQFKPGETELGKTSTVAKIPTVRRRTISFIEMKNSVRELAAILLRGGWFG
jgi:hypothetical protein